MATSDTYVGRYLELYKFDATNLGSGIIYLTPNDNNGQAITVDGIVYTPFPIASSSIEENTSGAQPSPTLMVSNINFNEFKTLLGIPEDITGVTVTKKVLIQNDDGTTEAEQDRTFIIAAHGDDKLNVKIQLRGVIPESNVFPAERMTRAEFPLMGES